MKKTGFVLFALLAAALIFVIPRQREIQRASFERLLNTAALEFFEGSLRLNSGYIDRSLKMHLDGLKGTLKSESGPAPLKIASLRSENRLADYFSPKGLTFTFDGVKPENSTHAGLSGRAEIHRENGGSFRFESKIEGLDLSEIAWLNPDNLKGAKGFFTGTITSDGKFTEDPHFQIVLVSQDGTVQAKFFEILLPYLPALPTKTKMEKLAKKEDALVGFRDAAIRIELPEPNKMKIFLHIQLPDYNVVLNVNFEIRLEETVSFSQLPQLLGIVKGNV